MSQMESIGMRRDGEDLRGRCAPKKSPRLSREEAEFLRVRSKGGTGEGILPGGC